jgi:hypothetical protein
MRRLTILSLLLFAIGSNFILSQPITFTKVHDVSYLGFHFTVEKLNDGYMIFSRSADSLTLADIVCISKADEYGEILWTKCYGNSQTRLWPGWCRSFGMLPDSTFYAGGSRDYGPGTSRAVLYRFDKNGDTIFTKEYGGVTPGLGFVIAYTARATSDGGFVLAGATNTMGRGKHDFYIVKTDSLGNVEWERAVGEYKDEDAMDMEITSNGDIYISGQSDSFWGTPPGAIQPCVAKLNSSGDLLWFKNYSTITPEFDGGSGSYIGLLDENNLVIIAGKSREPDAYSTAVILFKIDSSGQIKWNKEVPGGGNFYDLGSGFLKNQDNNFFLTGTGIVLSDPIELGQGPAIIGKFDSSGNTIYMKSFYEPGYTFQEGLCDMIPTPDGIAAVGFATAPQTPWMVKIDSNLCFGPDSCGPNLPVSRVSESYLAQQTLLLPYPNPSPDGVFNIRLPQRLTDKPALRQSQRRNMMDPLGSDFPHIHRDASRPARKKSPAPGIHSSDNPSIHLQAFDLQGREIPLEISNQSELLQVKLKQGSVRGMVVLKMQIGEEYWYGKVWVE